MHHFPSDRAKKNAICFRACGSGIFLYPSRKCQEMPNVIVKKSELEGEGIFATKDFKKGEAVFRFVGKKVPYKHCTHRSLQIGKNLFIRPADGALPGWLNHSCEPTCSVKKVNSITALRDIKKGEEITIDYSFTDSMPNWDMPCLCGKKACRRILKNYFALPIAYRKKHAVRTSEYLHS